MVGRIGQHVRQQFVGYVALFVALGGVSYAAIKLPADSVGSKEIRSGAVKTADLGKSAVTTGKVKDGSLLSKDFRPGQLVPGPAGAQGPPGPKGEPGAAGAEGAAGAPGTARGYGLVAGDGTVTLGKNLATANVSRLGTGGYCISGLPFTPENLIATAASPSPGHSVAAAIGAGTTACPAGTQVRVFVRNEANNLADHPFFLLLN